MDMPEIFASKGLAVEANTQNMNEMKFKKQAEKNKKARNLKKQKNFVKSLKPLL